MPIDLAKEEIFTLTEATRRIPAPNGKRVHVSTVWRWCRRGLCGVRLEYGKLGSRIVTSSQAISRFLNRLAEVDAELVKNSRRSSTAMSPSAQDCGRDHLESKEFLASRGIK